MTKKLDLSDFINTQIAQATMTPAQWTGQQQALAARETTQHVRQGRLKPTPQQVVGALTSRRQEAKDARAYAESWYRALYWWTVREVKIPYSFHYEPGPELEISTLGSNVRAPTRYLRTPAGEFTEGEVGTIITEMAEAGTVESKQLGKMLDKLRHENSTCPASLLREDGSWHQNRERVTRYAVAVLTLAVRLRVQEAEAPLHLMQAQLSALARV